MTNLKKTLAVVLALAMVFSMGIINTFAAYSDVTDGTVTAEAVGILSNLGIFTGFEDGTFKPDETVTRAQMAAIICRTLGYDEQAQSSMGSTAFADVAADHWASGYINVAQAQGIINGFPDGSFQPEAQVTYEQAVKMIVSALGYDLVAEAKGGYPSGYLAIASSEAITKNANGKVGDAAKRGSIAILVYNALEVPIMDQKSWTTNGEDSFGKTSDTILSKYLDVIKVEGIVTSTPFVEYADNGYDEEESPKMAIEGTKYYYEVNDNVVSSKKADYDEDGLNCSLVDADSLLGKFVVAYIGEEADDETNEVMVYAVSEKQNKNDVTTVSSLQLVTEDDDEFEVADQISYRAVGATRVTDLDIAEDVEIFVNFAPNDIADEVEEDEEEETLTTADLAEVLAAGGMAEFISNNSDEKIEYIIITAFDGEEAVIEEATEEEGVISFDLFAGDLEDIDTEDEENLIVVYKDGELATVKDLAANDTVSIATIHDTVTVLYVSSITVTGAVASYDDDYVTIGGVDYKVGLQYSGLPSALKDKEGIFFINVGGVIAHDEADVTATGNYGVVLAVAYENAGLDEGYVMQVMMQDGTVAVYNVSTKVASPFEDGETDDDEAAALAVAELIVADDVEVDLDESKAVLVAEKIENAIFKFTIKNGEITKIREIEGDTQEYEDGNTKKFDAESMSYGSMEFDENTLVFAIDSAKNDTEVTDDDIAVGALSAYIADGDDDLALIAFTEENKDTAAFVIGFALEASIPEDSAAVIVSAVKTVSYDDDEAIQITGIQAGEKVTYIIYDENSDYTDDPEDIEKGDVILVSAASAEGVVEDCKILLDIDAQTVADGDESDEIFNTISRLNAEEKATASKFWIENNVEFGETVWALAEDGITMKASANYTLVDYTDGMKNPVISKKSAGSSLFSSRYPAYVFVRVYDDVLAEVVVYRYDKDVEIPAIGAEEEEEVTFTTEFHAEAGTWYDMPCDPNTVVIIASEEGFFDGEGYTLTFTKGETTYEEPAFAATGWTKLFLSFTLNEWAVEAGEWTVTIKKAGDVVGEATFTIE